MTDEVKKTVVAILSDIISRPADSIEDNFLYSKSSMMDSFALINFLMELETQFDVQFTANDYSDESFQTLNGLVNKIIELQAENGNI